jgi:xylulose-5-phosphate/fructose-6-phosphate phosphoketolase
VSRDEEGMRRLFRQFSFPGGIPSHVAPETPGSIHEGGELGYALVHAYGAVFDNPDLIACCVVGDGEAETGPLAAAWHSNKFLNPVTDGAVLPILHLNGYKIANPAVLARISHEELEQLFRGYGYTPYFVEGDDPAQMHQDMAAAVDAVVAEIRAIQRGARGGRDPLRPRWPMIILRSPKGWTGPRSVDGKQTEGSWRSHQVPLSDMASKPEHVRLLQDWLQSYRPERAVRRGGRPRRRDCRAGAGGRAPHGRQPACQRRPAPARAAPARLPRLCGGGGAPRPGRRRSHPGAGQLPARRDRAQPGQLPRVRPRRDRLQPPGCAVRGHRPRVDGRARLDGDDHLAPDGRVMEVLSEHLCQGWLEGYLLTGRHGFFSCYEAFIHIIDSMFNQHAKWLKVTSREIPWRRPIASLNYLLTSHVWRQDHNGFSHQDPGFIDHVVNKKADIIRVYLPPDANTLLAVADHCLRSRNDINVIVAGKQPAPQWLSMDAAVKHCSTGIGIWEWASNDWHGGEAGVDQASEPDIVMACCGDVPTLETLAAVALLRELAPDLRCA